LEGGYGEPRHALIIPLRGGKVGVRAEGLPKMRLRPKDCNGATGGPIGARLYYYRVCPPGNAVAAAAVWPSD
jgi:hypothetical protein